MNKECNILIGQHPLVQQGAFEVHRLTIPAEEGGVVIENKGNIIFRARGSLAEDFVATGIVLREIDKGRKVLLIRNPADKFSRIE